MANPFGNGGDVKYTPGRVESDIGEYVPTEQDRLNDLVLERDNVMADLLEVDQDLDRLDDIIDDQMKDFEIPADELADAARRLCGKESIDWNCYKKAKDLLKVLPWITNGFDPVQAIHGKIKRHDGPIMFNCREFDMESYADALTDDDDVAEDNEDPELTPEHLSYVAARNQKDWALLMLFWDMLWGKPAMKEPFKTQSKAGTLNPEDVNVKINELKAAGEHKKAATLAESVLRNDFSSLIAEERPWHESQLKWESTKGDIVDYTVDPSSRFYSGYTIKQNKPYYSKINDNSAAIYPALDTFFDIDNGIKFFDLGIPALESGFILGLLMMLISLVPKVVTGMIKFLLKFLEKMSWIENITIVGDYIWPGIVSIIKVPFFLMTLLNNIFIHGCIWFAMIPNSYNIDIETTDELGEINSKFGPGIKTEIKPGPTNAGFIPPECFVYAEAIKNKVEKESL